MRARELLPKSVEVASAHPRNRLMVENHGDHVVIRALRDNFSPRQKSFFVRYLAAEGYIPEVYQGFADPPTAQSLPLSWQVEGPRTGGGHEAFREALWLVLSAALFWFLLMLLAFLHVLR